MLSVSLECLFLIAPSVISNVYLLLIYTHKNTPFKAVWLHVRNRYLNWQNIRWDIPYSKNSNVVPRIPNLWIMHQSPIKWGLKIILLYRPSITNFIFTITLNIFKKDLFCVCSKFWLVNPCVCTLYLLPKCICYNRINEHTMDVDISFMVKKLLKRVKWHHTSWQLP